MAVKLLVLLAMLLRSSSSGPQAHRPLRRASTSCAFNTSSSCAIHAMECRALCDLYQTTGGIAWRKSGGWGTGAPCASTWDGVTCTGSAVTGITLEDNNLEGSIPTTLSLLDSLEQLDFSSNNLTGELPASLSSMTALHFVKVSQNRFLSGTCPQDFPAMHNMSSAASSKSLALAVANLVNASDAVRASWSIGLTLTGLAVRTANMLDISGTRLSGTIPTALLSGGCGLNALMLGTHSDDFCSKVVPTCTLVGYASDGISGTIPSSLGSCTQMELLSMQDAVNISGTVPSSLSSLSRLQLILLGSVKTVDTDTLRTLGHDFESHLSGTIPQEVIGIQELIGVMFGTPHMALQLNRTSISKNLLYVQLQCLVSGNIEDLLSAAASIVYLNIENELRGTHLSGTLPNFKEIGSGQLMVHLELRNTTISGTLPRSFPSGLLELKLTNGNISGSIPTGLSNLIALTELNMHRQRLSGTLPSDLCSFQALSSMALWSIRLSGTLPSCLTALTRLRTVEMFNTTLSGTIPGHLSTLTSLAFLYLNFNQLEGTIPRNISALTLVDHMYFGNNPRLSGTIPNLLPDAGILTVFNVPFAKLSGTIPSMLAAAMYMHTGGDALDTIDVSSNRLSGTLPSVLSRITQLYALQCDSNRLSGTLPAQIVAQGRLQHLALFGNAFSGTLPRQMANASLLLNLFAAENRISGTIPALSGATALESIDLRSNAVSGSIPELARLKNLDFTVLSYNSLSGHMPTPLQDLSVLATLDLSNNQLSGTIVRVPNNTRTLTLSLNRKLSGTLPRTLLASTTIEAILAHNMALSGSIPAVRGSSLHTLSLARNYLSGSTDGLAGATGLRTLILSGNYLSCHAISLEQARHLSEGTFDDPNDRAQRDKGFALAHKTVSYFRFKIVINRFSKEVRTFKNLALAFAGNPQLTSDASYWPAVSPDRLTLKDAIRKGRRTIFDGHTQFKQLLLLLPVLMLVHGLAIVATIHRRKGNVPLRALRSYLWPSSMPGHLDPLAHLFRSILPTFAVLVVLGCSIVLLNLLTYSVYRNQGGCGADPLVATTIAPVRAGLAYQYIWVTLCAAVLASSVQLIRRLRRDSLTGHARSVHRCLCLLVACHSQHCLAAQGVAVWRARANLASTRRQWWRGPAFWIFHIPLLCVVSLPAVGFVLAQNIPAGSGFQYSLMGNTLVVAALKQMVSSIIVPPAARWLADFKHQTTRSDLHSEKTIALFKTRVRSTLAFDLTSILLAPMLAVSVLDESCLRYYLSFSPHLHELLLEWGIGEQGLGAFRAQFCGGRVATEFSYVWLTILLLDAFVRPSVALAEPVLSALKSKLRAGAKPSDHSEASMCQQTVGMAEAFQQRLSKAVTLTVMLLVFGVLVPSLLLVAWVGPWLHLCALTWLETHWEQRTSFGQRIAGSVLVHPPVTSFQFLVFLGNFLVVCVAFVDLEFEIGPIVLYLLMFVGLIGASRLRCFDRQKGNQQPIVMAPVVVSFRGCTHQQIEFEISSGGGVAGAAILGDQQNATTSCLQAWPDDNKGDEPIEFARDDSYLETLFFK